jgi:hypothetical protein
MDIGVMEETYEYYRAKKMKKNEEFLDNVDWQKIKRRGRNQPQKN